MHPIEVKSALESMVILVDTREQDTPLLRVRLQQMGRPWERQKLNVGDYSATVLLPNGNEFSLADKVAIERKLGIDEMCQCFTRERKRFEREFVRARESGAKVYLLIEDGSWEDVYSGRYRSRMKPKALVASLQAWLARYDCQILFCKPETSGKLIRDVLYRELKERLENLPDE